MKGQQYVNSNTLPRSSHARGVVRPTREVPPPDVSVATRRDPPHRAPCECSSSSPAVVQLCLLRPSPWTSCSASLNSADIPLSEFNRAAQRSRTSRSSRCNFGTGVTVAVFGVRGVLPRPPPVPNLFTYLLFLPPSQIGNPTTFHSWCSLIQEVSKPATASDLLLLSTAPESSRFPLALLFLHSESDQPSAFVSLLSLFQQ